MCVHKAIDPPSFPPLFKDVANENTTFVIMQNGVGNEDPFREAFPKSTIISCVVWVGAGQNTPGVIHHTKSEHTELGLFPNYDVDQQLEKSRLDRFAQLLTKGGTSISVEDNIQIQRWKKCVWNAAWNPITALTFVDTHTWLSSSSHATRITKQLMTEMIDAARLCEVPLEYDLIDELFEKILSMPPLFSSMYGDMVAKRRMEVEVILGTAVKKAGEMGMEVPVLSTLYSLTSAIDQSRQNK